MTMRRIIILVAVLAVFAAGGFGFWYSRVSASPPGPYRTEEAKRGDLLATFSATGTLEPEDIVDVGAQVAGQIKEFGIDAATGKPIDYGSEVDAGAVLARIDESIYQAKVNQSQANVTVAEASYQQAQAKVDDANANVKVTMANLAVAQANFDHAKRDWDRAQTLTLKQALAPADYDTYKSNYETTNAAVAQMEALVAQAKVQVKEAEAAAANAKAAVGAAQAQLAQDQINLGYCLIKAPVKGVIIDRRVTIGQTVQSSFNTPSLFLLARDLKRMKVWASVNEADIGKVKLGQEVKFTCDAFPGRVFVGKVGLRRLNATMTNNVVTYTVEVLIDNSDSTLLPYLTANLQFQVDERKDVLTVSNEALRWKPDIKQVAPDARGNYAKSMQKHAAAADGNAPASTTLPGASSGRGTVWVQEGQFVRPVRVKLGLSDGTRTEIVGGDLQEGAVVVTGDAMQVSADDSSNPFAPQMFGGKKQQ
jgi:HlyD family secretion protein